MVEAVSRPLFGTLPNLRSPMLRLHCQNRQVELLRFRVHFQCLDGIKVLSKSLARNQQLEQAQSPNDVFRPELVLVISRVRFHLAATFS
jgi:hypothetical protein